MSERLTLARLIELMDEADTPTDTTDDHWPQPDLLLAALQPYLADPDPLVRIQSALGQVVDGIKRAGLIE